MRIVRPSSLTANRTAGLTPVLTRFLTLTRKTIRTLFPAGIESRMRQRRPPIRLTLFPGIAMHTRTRPEAAAPRFLTATRYRRYAPARIRLRVGLAETFSLAPPGGSASGIVSSELATDSGESTDARCDSARATEASGPP